MSIYLGPDTKVLVQGITGTEGAFHTEAMTAFGTRIAGGVTPGKGGARVHDYPVFNSVEEAVARTGANVSIIFVPPKGAADAIMEAAAAGIGLIVCITEGIPIRDMTRAARFVKERGSILIGPNCPGIAAPGLRAKVGIMPNSIFSPGRIGVVSRSGTLTYEVVAQLQKLGFGESACVGIGGDPVIGQSFVDVLRRFNEDDETDAVILIGEIGGNMEQLAAAYVKEHMAKPVVAFIAGRTAPPGKRMGHAGAIVAGKSDTTEEKMAFLEQCGVHCVENLGEVGERVRKLL